MKYYKILTILLFSLTISLFSCKNDKKTTETPKQEAIPLNISSSASAYHYTCSQGCAGGAAAAGPCSTCGTALVHNQAFHNNDSNAQTTPQTSPITNPTSPTTPTPEPSQNAAGVWHYTCSKGCTGGAGSATSCSTCGNTLAHNTAYH